MTQSKTAITVALRFAPAGKYYPADYVNVTIRPLDLGHGTLTIDEQGNIMGANDFVSLAFGCAQHARLTRVVLWLLCICVRVYVDVFR